MVIVKTFCSYSSLKPCLPAVYLFTQSGFVQKHENYFPKNQSQPTHDANKSRVREWCAVGAGGPSPTFAAFSFFVHLKGEKAGR